MSPQRFNLLFLTTITVSFLLLNSAVATTFTVADGQGWVIPTSANTYTTWAANKTFVVGDILVFKFATGNHDVTGVSKAEFDSCSTANPIFTDATSPASVTLSSAGEKYYICGFSGHCSAGQKLSITVNAAAASPPTAAAPSPAPVTAPSPAGTVPAAAPAPGSGSGSPSPAVSSTPTSSAAPPPGATPPASATATPPSPSDSARFSVSAMVVVLVAAVGAFSY